MRLSLIPLVTALLPAVAINVSYLIAASQGHVAWCIPYIEGCTSISATGRQAPEAYVFRAAIIPTAVLLIVHWSLCHAWLKSLGGAAAGLNRAMLVLGVVAALALILYATVLGSIGDGYRLQRRIGVSVFYVCTVLAELLLTWQVVAAARRGALRQARRSVGLLAGLGLAIAVAGLLGLVLSAAWEGYGRYDDSVQWSFTLLMLAHIFVTGFAWRESGFRASFAVAER